MKGDTRFSDKIGAEYALFPLACPHYGFCQEQAVRPVLTFVMKHKLAQPRILEIGCGTGLTTQQLCKYLPYAEITALDSEAVMLEQARKVLPSNVTLVQSDALEYLATKKARSFDVVVTAFCLHNMPPDYREAVYREMGRVQYVRRRCIVVADKIAQDDILQHWQALRDQVDALSVFQDTPHPELQAEWTEHYLQDDRIRLTQAEQIRLLKTAGCSRTVIEYRKRMELVISGTND